MQVQPRSVEQKRRARAYRNFVSRLPPHAREAEIWMRYLHLVRSTYSSPFAAVFSVDDDGLLVIDWVDGRLDTSFSEFVPQLESQSELLGCFGSVETPTPAVLYRDWACIRLSHFCGMPAIGVAVHVAGNDDCAIDTTVLHSFEKVVSTFLELTELDGSATASLPWGVASARTRDLHGPS